MCLLIMMSRHNKCSKTITLVLLIRRTSVNSSATLVTIELVANNMQNTASYEVQHDGGGGDFYCRYSIIVAILASGLLCGHLPPSTFCTCTDTPCAGGDPTELKAKVVKKDFLPSRSSHRGYNN